jgi:hypothetical protein
VDLLRRGGDVGLLGPLGLAAEHEEDLLDETLAKLRAHALHTSRGTTIAGLFNRADHLAHPAAHAGLVHHRLAALAAVTQGDGFDRDRLRHRALAHAQVALGHVVGMVGHGNRLPAVNLHVAQLTFELRTARLALEALALHGQAALGPGQPRDADALGEVQRRLRVLLPWP